MDAQLRFEIKHQTIRRTDDFNPYDKTERYLYAHFDFVTEEWKGKVVTAIFRNNNVAYEVILDKNFECEVPWETLCTDDHYIQVSAFANDGTLITVGSASVFVAPSGYGDDLETSEDPTPSVYAQIMARLEEVERIVVESARSAKASEESASNSATTAVDASTDAVDAKNDAIQSAENATQGASSARDYANSASDSALSATSSSEHASLFAQSASSSAQSASTYAENAASSARYASETASEVAQNAEKASQAAESTSKDVEEINAKVSEMTKYVDDKTNYIDGGSFTDWS